MRILTLAALPFLLLTAGQAPAHSGRTDDIAGHRYRAQGTYHFHSGPLAGQTFSDKATATEALRRLHQLEADEEQRRTDLKETQESDSGQTEPP